MRREHTRDKNRLWRAALVLICALSLALPAHTMLLDVQPVFADEPVEPEYAEVIYGDGSAFSTTMGIRLFQTFTVSFDAGDAGNAATGMPSVSQTVNDYDAYAVRPSDDPAWADHVFKHWYIQGESPTIPFDFSSYEVTSDLVLVAAWAEQVKVYFDAAGGTLPSDMENPVTVAEGTPIARPADPTRDKHLFEYWYVGDAAGAGDQTIAYNFTTPVEGLLYLYAKWTPLVHKVTYDESVYDASGNLNVKSGTVVTEYAGDTGAAISWEPAREGYGFLGWTATGAVSVSSPAKSVDIPAGSQGEVRLTAHWEQSTGSIGLSPVDPSDPDTEIVGSGPAGGTAVAIRLMDGDETNATDVVLVTFYPRNGSAATALTLKKGDVLTAPAVPVRGGGFVFSHWSTREDGATIYDFAQPLTGDLTLYGCWDETDAAGDWVTFNVPAYRGTDVLRGSIANDGTVTEYSFADGDLGIYKIDGYFTDAAYTQPFDFTRDTVKNGDVLYAKCVATVRLHAESGSVATAGWVQEGTIDVFATNYVYGTSGLTIPGNNATTTDVTRDSWEFLHWCVDSALTKPLVSSAAPVVVGAANLQAEYWAAWDPYVTFEFYKYADGEGKYDYTASIAASDTTTQVTLPSTEPAMADGTAASGLAGHMLTTWYVMGSGESAGATGRIDTEAADAQGTAFAADGSTKTVSAFLATTPTAPVTVKLFAGWRATIQATTVTDLATFIPTPSTVADPVTSADSVDAITITSGTARPLAVAAQSVPCASANAAAGTAGYDYTGNFRDAFKMMDGSEADEEHLKGTALSLAGGAASSIAYMGDGKAPGAVSGMLGTIAAFDGTSAKPTLTGNLHIALASGLRTLNQTEAAALMDQDGYTSAGITTLKWMASMSAADAHAYVFNHDAPTYWN